MSRPWHRKEKQVEPSRRTLTWSKGIESLERTIQLEFKGRVQKRREKLKERILEIYRGTPQVLALVLIHAYMRGSDMESGKGSSARITCNRAPLSHRIGNSGDKWHVRVTQSCLTLCDPMGWVHGILQNNRVGSLSLLQGSSQPRDRAQVSHIAGGLFTSWAPRETQE